jgi:hypothetical protein
VGKFKTGFFLEEMDIGHLRIHVKAEFDNSAIFLEVHLIRQMLH